MERVFVSWKATSPTGDLRHSLGWLNSSAFAHLESNGPWYLRLALDSRGELDNDEGGDARVPPLRPVRPRP